jgi:tetratricopeptide (TPR) repeat protein
MRNALIFMLVSLAAAASLLGTPAFAAPTPSPAAKAAYERGEKAREAQQWGDAVSAYEDALRATPGYALALNGMGTALFKQKKAAEAIVQFKAATVADPSFKDAWFNLGYAARKSGDYASAVPAYEKYIALDSSDLDGLYGLADAYRGVGQNDKALSAYETYVKKAPATEQKTIDKARDAIAQLKAAPAPAPTPVATPPPANTTTTTTTTTTAAQPATTTAQPAPETNALAGPAKKKLDEGDKLWAEKKFREASFSYQDAVNAEPNNIEALFKLGNAYAMLGYYSQAIDRWAKVEQLTPDPGVKKSAQDNIARAQQKMTASNGAATPQEANKPPATGPVADSTRTQSRQYYEAGVQLIGQRRYGEALNYLNECLKLEPALTVGYVARGSTLIGLRRFAEAAIDYGYALKLDANMSSPLYGLAEAYRGMNRIEDARAYYQKYITSTSADVRPELQTDARQKLDTLH